MIGYCGKIDKIVRFVDIKNGSKQVQRKSKQIQTVLLIYKSKRARVIFLQYVSQKYVVIQLLLAFLHVIRAMFTSRQIKQVVNAFRFYAFIIIAWRLLSYFFLLSSFIILNYFYFHLKWALNLLLRLKESLFIQQQIFEVIDDPFNAIVSQHHFLVVAMALGGRSSFYFFAHHQVHFLVLFLLKRKLQQVSTLFQKFYVSSLLMDSPVVVFFPFPSLTFRNLFVWTIWLLC